MNGTRFELFTTLEEAGRAGAALTARAARDAVRERGLFTLALSGGSTPGRYFELLAGEDIPWGATHVFWADERLVAPDSPASNYRLAWEKLLSRAPIPEANVHPMAGGASLPARDPAESRSEDRADFSGRGWLLPPDKAAEACEASLRHFFGDPVFPVFDVIHLGLGGDGHTASLFPGQPSLDEATRWVLPVSYAGATPPVPRLTLTLPVINAARWVFFLVSGPDKIRLTREILGGGGGKYPAGRVRPEGGAIWLAGE